jgi:phosphate transport system substrate-binding protein
VAEGVTSTKNSISYMEWSYAKDNNLKTAELDSGNGPVPLSGEAVGKAVAEATTAGSGNDLSLKLKYADTAEGAYPALLVTYEIVCSKGLEADKTAILQDFLGYFASDTTQQGLEELGYAPLPADLLTKVQASVDAIS